MVILPRGRGVKRGNTGSYTPKGEESKEGEHRWYTIKGVGEHREETQVVILPRGRGTQVVILPRGRRVKMGNTVGILPRV